MKLSQFVFIVHQFSTLRTFLTQISGRILAPVVRVLASFSVSRPIKLVMLGMLTTVLIAACSSNVFEQTTRGSIANLTLSSNSSDCRLVKHDAGETQVCGKPQRVVALGPHSLDLLLSLDMQLVGYADYFSLYSGEYFDNPSQQIPYLGSWMKNNPVNLGASDKPSLEGLSRLQPDLIVGETGGNQSNYALLSQIAPTILWGNRTQKDYWKYSIQEIGKALGLTEKAKQLILENDQRLAAARIELAPAVKAHPKILLVGGNQLNENIAVFERDSYIGSLLADLGFQLVSLPEQKKFFQSINISLELLPALNAADTIFVMGHNIDPNFLRENVIENQMKNVKQEWSKNAIAQTLKASQEGRVYFVTYYLWNGLNGPIGTQLILEELRQLLL